MSKSEYSSSVATSKPEASGGLSDVQSREIRTFAGNIGGFYNNLSYGGKWGSRNTFQANYNECRAVALGVYDIVSQELTETLKANPSLTLQELDRDGVLSTALQSKASQGLVALFLGNNPHLKDGARDKFKAEETESFRGIIQRRVKEVSLSKEVTKAPAAPVVAAGSEHARGRGSSVGSSELAEAPSPITRIEPPSPPHVGATPAAPSKKPAAKKWTPVKATPRVTMDQTRLAADPVAGAAQVAAVGAQPASTSASKDVAKPASTPVSEESYLLEADVNTAKINKIGESLGVVINQTNLGWGKEQRQKILYAISHGEKFKDLTDAVTRVKDRKSKEVVVVKVDSEPMPKTLLKSEWELDGRPLQRSTVATKTDALIPLIAPAKLPLYRKIITFDKKVDVANKIIAAMESNVPDKFPDKEEFLAAIKGASEMLRDCSEEKLRTHLGLDTQASTRDLVDLYLDRTFNRWQEAISGNENFEGSPCQIYNGILTQNLKLTTKLIPDPAKDDQYIEATGSAVPNPLLYEEDKKTRTTQYASAWETAKKRVVVAAEAATKRAEEERQAALATKRNMAPEDRIAAIIVKYASSALVLTNLFGGKDDATLKVILNTLEEHFESKADFLATLAALQKQYASPAIGVVAQPVVVAEQVPVATVAPAPASTPPPAVTEATPTAALSKTAAPAPVPTSTPVRPRMVGLLAEGISKGKVGFKAPAPAPASTPPPAVTEAKPTAALSETAVATVAPETVVAAPLPASPLSETVAAVPALAPADASPRRPAFLSGIAGGAGALRKKTDDAVKAGQALFRAGASSVGVAGQVQAAEVPAPAGKIPRNALE